MTHEALGMVETKGLVGAIEAAERVGMVISTHVIPCPHHDVEAILPKVKGE